MRILFLFILYLNGTVLFAADSDPSLSLSLSSSEGPCVSQKNGQVKKLDLSAVWKQKKLDECSPPKFGCDTARQLLESSLSRSSSHKEIKRIHSDPKYERQTTPDKFGRRKDTSFSLLKEVFQGVSDKKKEKKLSPDTTFDPRLPIISHIILANMAEGDKSEGEGESSLRKAAAELVVLEQEQKQDQQLTPLRKVLESCGILPIRIVNEDFIREELLTPDHYGSQLKTLFDQKEKNASLFNSIEVILGNAILQYIERAKKGVRVKAILFALARLSKEPNVQLMKKVSSGNNSIVGDENDTYITHFYREVEQCFSEAEKEEQQNKKLLEALAFLALDENRSMIQALEERLEKTLVSDPVSAYMKMADNIVTNGDREKIVEDLGHVQQLIGLMQTYKTLRLKYTQEHVTIYNIDTLMNQVEQIKKLNLAEKFELTPPKLKEKEGQEEEFLVIQISERDSGSSLSSSSSSSSGSHSSR